MKKVLTILAAAALALSSLGAQELTNFAFGGRGPRIVSPEVKDGKVTFRLRVKAVSGKSPSMPPNRKSTPTTSSWTVFP